MIEVIKLPEIFSSDGSLTKIHYQTSKKNLYIKEVYLNDVYFEKVKGWILHKKATIYMKVIKGKINLSFIENKLQTLAESKPSELTIPDNTNQLIVVNKQTWFKFKGINSDKSTILVMSDHFHDPSERIKSSPNLIPKFFN